MVQLCSIGLCRGAVPPLGYYESPFPSACRPVLHLTHSGMLPCAALPLPPSKSGQAASIDRCMFTYQNPPCDGRYIQSGKWLEALKGEWCFLLLYRKPLSLNFPAVPFFFPVKELVKKNPRVAQPFSQALLLSSPWTVNVSPASSPDGRVKAAAQR